MRYNTIILMSILGFGTVAGAGGGTADTKRELVAALGYGEWNGKPCPPHAEPLKILKLKPGRIGDISILQDTVARVWCMPDTGDLILTFNRKVERDGELIELNKHLNISMHSGHLSIGAGGRDNAVDDANRLYTRKGEMTERLASFVNFDLWGLRAKLPCGYDSPTVMVAIDDNGPLPDRGANSLRFKFEPGSQISVRCESYDSISATVSKGFKWK